MKRALELARSGHGQIVAAVAEAGTGKSRLLYEFKHLIPKECMVLEAYSVSHGKASAYLPVLDLLYRYFGIEDADGKAARRTRIQTRINALDPALNDTLPLLCTLMGLIEGPDPIAQMDPQIKRRRMLDAIKRIILRESLNQPTIAIFEDLHWIDGETQALLDLLATASPMRACCYWSTIAPSTSINGATSPTTRNFGWIRSGGKARGRCSRRCWATAWN
jgi:predicted ATPase